MSTDLNQCFFCVFSESFAAVLEDIREQCKPGEEANSSYEGFIGVFIDYWSKALLYRDMVNYVHAI